MTHIIRIFRKRTCLGPKKFERLSQVREVVARTIGLAGITALAACTFDTHTSGARLEDADLRLDAAVADADDTAIDAAPSDPDAMSPSPDAAVADAAVADAGLTPDADLTPDASVFVDPDPIADLIFALPQSDIVVDGVIDEWQDFSWVDISAPADYVQNSGTTGDSSDISASIAARWTPTTLYLAVRVQDDTYVNDSTGELLWQGDSLQIAFDVADNNGAGYDTTDDFEYGWARATGDALESYRWAAPTAQGPYVAAPYNVIRGGTSMVYELTLTAGDLGLASFSAASADIGISWLINDNDGAGREGFLEWTSGIGNSKNPGQFGSLRFHPSGP